jgi:hypothetical protein
LFKDALGDLIGLAHCLESSTGDHVGIVKIDGVIHVAAFPPRIHLKEKRIKTRNMFKSKGIHSRALQFEDHLFTSRASIQ